MKRILLIILILTFSFSGINAEPTTPPPPYSLLYKLLTWTQQQDNTNILLQSSADKTLKLRLKKDYEIFDAKGKLIMKGNGKEIDIRELPAGKYTIKFDKDYNQIEYFKKV